MMPQPKRFFAFPYITGSEVIRGFVTRSPRGRGHRWRAIAERPLWIAEDQLAFAGGVDAHVSDVAQVRRFLTRRSVRFRRGGTTRVPVRAGGDRIVATVADVVNVDRVESARTASRSPR